MTRETLIAELIRTGCVLLKQGASHDLYSNPETGKKQAVPKQHDIDEAVVHHIKTYLGLTS